MSWAHIGQVVQCRMPEEANALLDEGWELLGFDMRRFYDTKPVGDGRTVYPARSVSVFTMGKAREEDPAPRPYHCPDCVQR